ncbi:MAG: hypothetical protein NTX24_03365 [Candidatus Pacearchaeota archaeon]|nr:hypothetical protein [Candidatus Pacearchaeota archaeon]
MIYNTEKREIICDRELSNLDKLVLKFIRILERHIDYVLISGYVAILLGRTRATEDVDVFIRKVDKEKFFRFYEELKNNGLWCINAEKPEELFSYLREGLAVRFALENTSIPNFEVKIVKREDEDVFDDFIVVKLKEGNLKISSLERQIAFKRYFLCSGKDMEDALHVERIFKDKIDYKKIDKLKEIIEKRKNE